MFTPNVEEVRTEALSCLLKTLGEDDFEVTSPTEIQNNSEGQVLYFNLFVKSHEFRVGIAAKDIHFVVTTAGDEVLPTGYEEETEEKPTNDSLDEADREV